MRTLLIGWELGGGAGHIHRLVPIIARYLADDWTVVAALRLRHTAEAHFAPLFPVELATGRLVVVQAPIFLHRRRAMRASSLAEMFAQIGFAEPELLTPVVRAWERLLLAHQPDALISDIAPSLNLAAAGRMPVVVIGNGWTIPPDTEKAALFDERPDARLAANRAAAMVAESVRRVTDGRSGSERFSDLLRGTDNFICTLPVFDPYEGQRREPYHWPFEIPSSARSLDREPTGVIYLPRDHPALPAVFDAISKGTRAFTGYFSGDVPARANLHVSPVPLDLAEMLPRSAVAIHHGGLGTAINCWVHRVPQVVLPADTEKMVVGRGLQRSKAGIALPIQASAQQMLLAIKSAAAVSVDEPNRTRMATLDPKDTLAALSKRCD